MKTTLELPDPLFRKVKATAAERGQSIEDFVTEVLRDKLAPDLRGGGAGAPAWMQGYGALKRLNRETVRVQFVVDQEFDTIVSEDRH
jgi:hypothetical protein